MKIKIDKKYFEMNGNNRSVLKFLELCESSINRKVYICKILY